MQVVSDIKIVTSLGISDIFILKFYADIVIKMYISNTFLVSFKVFLNDFHLRSRELGFLVINPNIVI